MVNGSLPPGWVWTTIGELTGDDGVFIDGDWVESKDQDPNGEVRLVQLADIGDGYYRDRSDRYLTYKKAIELGCTFLQEGDVLIARMPDPLGRACIFPGDPKKSVTVVDVCIVRSGKNIFNHRWLMYVINSTQSRAEIESYQSGSTRKRISRSNLSKIFFPIPPLPEQERIVARIESLFTQLEAGVAALKRARAALKRYKASVLKAACEGRLVAQEAGDESVEVMLRRMGKEPLAGDGLAELPRGWAWATWDQVVLFSQNGFGKRKSDSGMPTIVLRLADVVGNHISLDNVRRIGATKEEINKYELITNDIICIRVNGSLDNVGRMIVFQSSMEPVTFCDHFIRFRLVEPEMALFLAMYFDTDRCESLLNTIGYQALVKIQLAKELC